MKMQGYPPEWAWSEYSLPDAQGHFGPYGGTFVAETLRGALDELTLTYSHYREDPQFRADLAAFGPLRGAAAAALGPRTAEPRPEASAREVRPAPAAGLRACNSILRLCCIFHPYSRP